MPKVSVIIPVFNSGAFIARALQSALAQTFTDFEIIVVDDGSTDDTASIVKLLGSRIHYVYQPHQERAVARNTGLRQARGQYIAFLDADDSWYPQKLEKQIAVLQDQPLTGLVCSWADQIGPDGQRIGCLGKDVPATSQGTDLFEWFFLGSSLPTLTVLVRADMLQRLGGFSADITYVEDWDMWSRVAIYGPIACVQENLATYQLHGCYLPGTFDRHNMQEGRPLVLRRLKRLAEETRGRVDAALERRAFARAYWYGALIDFAVGQDVAGQSRSLRSLNIDPEFFEGGAKSALDMLVGFARGLYDTGATLDQAFRFIGHALRKLPSPMQNYFSHRRVRGLLNAAYAFDCYHAGKRRQARLLMSRAVLGDPRLLCNRGVLAVFSSLVRTN